MIECSASSRAPRGALLFSRFVVDVRRFSGRIK